MIHRIKIEKIITGGFGLGRLATGQIVLTRFVLPDETVLVRETVSHRGYLEAMPVEILSASPFRISPPCPYFTLCGGCDFQHIDISLQRRIKKDMVGESLERAGLNFPGSSLQAMIPSPQPFHYRHRIRLKVGPEGQLGFFRTGSNELVPISRCLLATERINDALLELERSSGFRKFAAEINEIEILHSPADDLVFVKPHLRNREAKAQTGPGTPAEFFSTFNDHLINKQKNRHLTDGVWQSAVLRQQFDTALSGRSFTLSWSPECFFQTNIAANRQLVDIVCRDFMRTGGTKILELYCGMGNFSIPLAHSGSEITGVEQNRHAVHWAKLNARQSCLDNCDFQVGEAGRSLRDFISRGDQYDVVLLDPPRQGLGRHSRTVAELAPAHILYISCDPATLARDLAVLTGKGYILKNLTTIDMFPQTHHIETVALLEKN